MALSKSPEVLEMKKRLKREDDILSSLRCALRTYLSVLNDGLLSNTAKLDRIPELNDQILKHMHICT